MDHTRDLVTVDLSGDAAAILAGIRQGCQGLGFFYVTGHGIPRSLIDAHFKQSKLFFSQSEADKQVHKAPYMTSEYCGVEQFKAQAKGQKAPESREKMRISLVDADLTKHSLGKLAPPAELLGGKAAEHHPLWPASDALPGYKATILDYFTAVSALSDELLKCMARSLALPEDAFTADDAAASGAPWRSLVLHHYTSELGCPGEGKFGMGAHKDRMSMLTIVANEPGSDGLEALDGEGNWFAVPPKPGALIVNVGSMLELWTGGAFTAVVHRVVNRSGRERYSSAFFRANAMDTVCRPLLAPTDVQPKAGSNNASSSGNAVVDCVLDELRPVRVGSVYNALPFYRIGDGSVTAASVVQAAA